MSNVSPLVRANFGPAPVQAIASSAPVSDMQMRDGIAGYIRSCFDAAKQHRQNEGIDQRMIEALRAVRGEYDPAQLKDIETFGGSKVYARITASKVRGVAALLREVYFAAERPWTLSPTPDPDLSGPTLQEAVIEVLKAEMMEVMAAGVQPTADMIQQRMTQLKETLLQARKKTAQEGLRIREEVIDDILWEGGFYTALWDFLLDIATFPFAVLKGPVVSFKRTVKWEGKTPTVKNVPTLQWSRCSPFDTFFAPWSQTPQDGYIIHRQRTTRASLQALVGLPSYDADAIRRVLSNSAKNMQEWWDYVENERAQLEQRESDISPLYASQAVDRPMPMLEFNGPVSGELLRTWGMSEADVPDVTQDLDITAYLIGGEVIGIRKNPHPAGFKPFYVDSFERVPGSIYGHAVPDLISDVQNVANASIRALVNNLSIASGPMAWVNEDRLASNDADSTKMWPWKVFRTTDSMNSTTNEEPMKFFQPDSNAQTLLMVYDKFAQMADELSSLPRYMQGNTAGLGGAGRTASGLSMMIEASNRTIKQTISSVDKNVIEEVVEHLNIYLALMRPDIVVEGDISVVARGAVELAQRETLRMRRLEFLNITNNPADLQIVGLAGRANVLKEISRDLGMPLADVMAFDPSKIAQMPPQGAPGQPPGAQSGAQPGQDPGTQEQPGNPTQGVARTQQPSPGQ